ncbi:acetyltransferase [Arthrobacter sp. MYb227]|uniref:NeuD/PglB/VioB family sugar acetyltransferase n=1 Tax=Arthrobacter sp. MYb227 TaxID=1848601 RepID=UPI000CFCFDEB|nr:NeuD/PglB/VioB family sugar acetyltransferase [Arthrobacter sp. MYb227]PQZ91080.1 acetyltransferase [Arthrobacter sp. MYb227]
MSRVLLLAAGGLARETASSIAATGDHQILGMLDDSPTLHGQFVAGLEVLGGIEQATTIDAQLLICAGSGAARQSIVASLARLGVENTRYATHVSDAAQLGARTTLGRGSIILPGCVLTCDIEVGRHVVLMPNVVLTHDNWLGDYATLAAGVTLGGSTQIGALSYVGMQASVRQGLVIGDGATLGMGSVLLQDQPAHSIWAGNPARMLKHHPDQSTTGKSTSSKTTIEDTQCVS